MIAGALGVLVLVLALLAARKRQPGVLQVVAAAVLVALAIGLYMRGMHVAASALAIAGEAILPAAALRWSNVALSRTAALAQIGRAAGWGRGGQIGVDPGVAGR